MTDHDYLNDLPETHERAKITMEAQLKLELAYVRIAEEYGLTTGERLRVLSNALHIGLSNIAKYAIRHERHGSGDKPGDLE
jgi:hypothetical protein